MAAETITIIEHLLLPPMHECFYTVMRHKLGQIKPYRESLSALFAHAMNPKSGLVALLVAITHVVLPYELAYIGMSRAEIHVLHDRLLPYMAHNRASLARRNIFSVFSTYLT
jgi:hypothetical protein